MVVNTVDEDNEYEAQRAANIAKNQALLRELQLNAASAGLAVFTGAGAGNGSRSSPAARTRTTTRAQHTKAKATAAAGSKRKSRGGNGNDDDDDDDGDDDDDDDDANAEGASRRKKPKKKEQLRAAAATAVPRRTSSRLAGLPADSELARQKAVAEQAALEAAARAKRQRVSADLELGDIVVAGRKWDSWMSGGSSFLGDAAIAHGNRASQNDDSDRKKKPEDAAFKALRRRMGALKLYETFEPNSKPFRHLPHSLLFIYVATS